MIDRLNWLSLNNRDLRMVGRDEIDDALLERCSAAMAGAVGGGRGLLVNGALQFPVIRLDAGARGDRGGCWQIGASDGTVVITLALCVDAGESPAIWQAAHDTHEPIITRSFEPSPALPWMATIIHTALIVNGRGLHLPPVDSPQHLAWAWIRLWEANAIPR